ncbi:Pex12 amino terminal region-domain-containing protein [Lipomyces tetrasporus]|uniref:RING-type E3 ubiquitin transferase (cysteine targeting) n=1 Tax=Lipomyces tetrasporus TaxID=54092 RepID=A0AAD7QPQ9_9ASCO|nr:Pex12 amino terminal region-domain-containing protein [Lipomyces tetrasporus]KAJ8099119.1 Pex12 amino terminal region-domain-containing protein [Lipomyces tetrasporus]
MTPRVQNLLSQLTSTANYPSIRVGQLDAALLDNELFDILKSQIWDCSKYIQSQIKEHYITELSLLLKVLAWKVTVWDHSATYGGLLQNLRIVDARHGLLSKGVLRNPSRRQKLAIGLLTVFGDYIWHKLIEYMAERTWEENSTSWKRWLYKTSQGLDSLYSILDLANFVTFLFNGKYPTLLYRLCRLRMVSSSRALSREVSFEFLNRQLVWKEFTNFLLFVLPIIHIPRLKRTFNKMITTASSKTDTTTGHLSFLPERTCAICYYQDSRIGGLSATADPASIGVGSNDITNPYVAVECGHIYCYVCLVTQIEEQEGEGWRCLRCGELIKKARVWIDVDESIAAVRDHSNLVTQDLHGDGELDEDGEVEAISEGESSANEGSLEHSENWSKIRFDAVDAN